MTTSQLISSLRSTNKEWTADTRITDRYIYNEALSVTSLLFKQEEIKSRLMSFDSIFKTLKKVELIEVDSVEACGIKTDCIIKRTKYKLPEIFETAKGKIFRLVSSLDGSQSITGITQSSWVKKQSINDKHAKNELFYWIEDDYLYFPNISWDYVKIEAAFKNHNEIDILNECDPDESSNCSSAYDLTFNIPDYLEKSLKDLLNESLLRYYHRLRFDDLQNKNPAK